MVKLFCSRKALHEVLATASRAVNGRSTLPILSHVLVRAEADRLEVNGSDFELWMKADMAASVVEPGAATFPGKLLTEIVGSLPDGEVSLAVDENNVLLLTCLRSEYTIRGLPAQDYPVPPKVDGGMSLTMEQALLRRLIGEVSYAAGHNETRALMCGANVTILPGAVKMEATDTYRLAVSTLPIPGLVPADGQESVIVPNHALEELRRGLADEGERSVEVQFGKGNARFVLDGLELTTRLIEGQFLNFERVIPREWEKQIVANRQELLEALKRVLRILPRQGTHKVIFRMEAAGEGLLSLATEAGEVGRAAGEVEATLTGGQVEMAFNGAYVVDALAAMETDQVALEVSRPLNPGMLRPLWDEPPAEGRSYISVLMPMAIQ